MLIKLGEEGGMAVLDVPVREMQGSRNGRAEFLFHGLHPARSILPPRDISTKDLAMIFNNVPFIHIVVRVNASLDGCRDLRATSLVGMVKYLRFQLG